MLVLLNAKGQRIDAAPEASRIFPRLKPVGADRIFMTRFARAEEQRFFCHDGYFCLRQAIGEPSPFHLINGPFYQQFGITTRVSQNPLAAQADAREFVAFMQGRPGDFSVVEFGIGNGHFTMDFIRELYKREPALLARMRYFAVDNSYPLLAAFQKENEYYLQAMSTNVALVLCDPFQPFPAMLAGKNDVMLIRFNEFYDDLPATEILFRQGRAYELYVRLFLSSVAGSQALAGVTPFSLMEGILRFATGDKGPRVEEIKAVASDVETILSEEGQSLRKFLPHLNVEVGYGQVDDLAGIDFAFLLEGQTGDGEPITLNYAAYHHFLACLGLLKRSGGYMRFNDYRPKFSLSQTLLGLPNHGYFTSPINWDHFRRLARDQGVSFESQPHEAHVSQWQGKDYLDPAIITDKELLAYLTKQAIALQIPDPRMVECIITDYAACLDEKTWVTIEELLLEIPEEIKTMLEIEDLNYARWVKCFEVIRKRTIGFAPGTKKVDALAVEKRYVDYLFRRGEFKPLGIFEEKPDPFVHIYGEGYAWFARVTNEQIRYEATRDFVLLMFNLFGANWRETLLSKIRGLQGLAPTMLSAKVL